MKKIIKKGSIWIRAVLLLILCLNIGPAGSVFAADNPPARCPCTGCLAELLSNGSCPNGCSDTLCGKCYVCTVHSDPICGCGSGYCMTCCSLNPFDQCDCQDCSLKGGCTGVCKCTHELCAQCGNCSACNDGICPDCYNCWQCCLGYCPCTACGNHNPCNDCSTEFCGGTCGQCETHAPPVCVGECGQCATCAGKLCPCGQCSSCGNGMCTGDCGRCIDCVKKHVLPVENADIAVMDFALSAGIVELKGRAVAAVMRMNTVFP